MMSARDQRAETFKIQQDGGTKDGRKDKLKGKKEFHPSVTFGHPEGGLFVHFKRKVLFKISYSNLKTHSYNS